MKWTDSNIKRYMSEPVALVCNLTIKCHCCSFSLQPDYQMHSPTQHPLSAHHCVLVGQRPLPQHTINFYQPLSTYVHNYEIGRKPAIADDIYHYPE